MLFVLGLLSGALAYELAVGGTGPVSIQTTLPVLLLAGLLVGFGTRLGSGCTSGHGIRLLVALYAGALFGLGLSGFCSGPVVAALATGLVPVFAFVGAMMPG